MVAAWQQAVRLGTGVVTEDLRFETQPCCRDTLRMVWEFEAS